MGFEIENSDVGVAVKDVSRDLAFEAARRANTAGQEILQAEGDELDYETFPVVQSATRAQWDDARDAYVFGYTHPAARFFNDGTQTHEIVADEAEVLAFEWPDAPPEVQEMFESTFPTVFFPSVEVEGLPAIRYVERGLRQGLKWLEGR